LQFVEANNPQAQLVLQQFMAESRGRDVRVLGLDIAGLDYLYDEDIGFRICEANSSPGFEGLEAACGVDVPAFVYQFLDVKFRVSAKTKRKLLESSD
jgi:gamma-F420-2:alpha-L-glutamate ligase